MSADTLNLEILGARPPEGVPAHPTPLVFLHGAFAGAWTWAEYFLPAFAARGYTCLAPSFRGHGGSDGRDSLSRATISDYVADLASAVDGLARPPVLIGHSMGGFVAMKYAERAPVAGLALFASVPPGGLLGASLSLALFQPTLLAEIGMAQTGRPDALSWEGLRQALFSKTVSKERVDRYLPMMGPESPAAVADMHGRVTVDPRRVRGAMPILVAGARRDSLVPAAYVRSTARQLGVPAVLLDDIGHGMMLDENWPAAAGVLADWLDAHDI